MHKPTSPAKWQELFAKGVREGVQVRQLGSGQWIATSVADPGKAYAVSLSECECRGHEYHSRCKHRAMLAFRVGVLTIGQPAAPVAPTPICRFGCKGTGYHADPDGRSAPERCPCRDGARIAA